MRLWNAPMIFSPVLPLDLSFSNCILCSSIIITSFLLQFIECASRSLCRGRPTTHALPTLISSHDCRCALWFHVPAVSYMPLSRCVRQNKKANAKETTLCVDSQCVGLQLDDFSSSHLHGYDSYIIIHHKPKIVKPFAKIYLFGRV